MEYRMSNKEPQNDEVFTRLRQDAPCGSTGRIGLRQRLRPDRDGDRRPRRSPQGEAGLASAQFRLALPQMPRAEARGASLQYSNKDRAFKLQGLNKTDTHYRHKNYFGHY